MRIAVVITVQNSKLFEKTKKSIPKLFDTYVIDGKYGFYGLEALELVFQSEQLKDYDWIIMADEDVIFLSTSNLYDLVYHMTSKDFAIAGMNDGDLVEFRKGCEFIPNLFFCVFNNHQIRKNFKWSIFLQFKLDKEKKYLSSSFIKSEPYYVFFEYLYNIELKTMFLSGCHNIFPDDFETTKLFNHNGDELIAHTWYARSYQKDIRHTNRIDRAISNFSIRNYERSYRILNNPKHNFYFRKYWRKKIKKFVKTMLLYFR